MHDDENSLHIVHGRLDMSFKLAKPLTIRALFPNVPWLDNSQRHRI